MSAKRLLKPLGRLHSRVVHRRRTRVLAECLSTIIPRGHRVLDVGCGDGLIAALTLQARPDLEIRGVDVFIRGDSRIPVQAFDGITLPFAAGAFDTVMACDVLHHTLSPVDVLREMARVASNSVVVKDHVVRGVAGRATLRFMDFIGNAPHGVALPYNYLTAAEWDEAVRTCGLTPAEVVEALSLYPWYANPVFGRRLHFVCRFTHRSASGCHDRSIFQA